MFANVELERIAIKRWIDQHLTAWEARDAQAISDGLHPEICFMVPTAQWVGHHRVQVALASRLAEWQRIRLRIRRILIDAIHQTAAIEWICRYAGPEEQGCREILGATILDFAPTGQVRHWHTYLDTFRRRTLSDWEAPLPDEDWSPSLTPGLPPSRQQLEQIIRAKAAAWSSHDLASLSEIMHDEICIQPPWDYQLGQAAVETGARVYFANYRDTLVTPRRFIIDSTQPYFGVCEQTFACTNPDTGQRGEDHDFAFFEVAQGKLRYWRTYFDTSHSAQVIEKTAGFLQR